MSLDPSRILVLSSSSASSRAELAKHQTDAKLPPLYAFPESTVKFIHPFLLSDTQSLADRVVVPMMSVGLGRKVPVSDV